MMCVKLGLILLVFVVTWGESQSMSTHVDAKGEVHWKTVSYKELVAKLSDKEPLPDDIMTWAVQVCDTRLPKLVARICMSAPLAYMAKRDVQEQDEGRAKIAEQALYLFNIDPRYLGRSIEKRMITVNCCVNFCTVGYIRSFCPWEVAFGPSNKPEKNAIPKLAKKN